MKPPRLTGQALADCYAAYLGRKLNQTRGKVYAHYEGSGWIVARGEGLEPHPDMKARYPNGWSLLHRVRSGKVRAELISSLSR